MVTPLLQPPFSAIAAPLFGLALLFAGCATTAGETEAPSALSEVFVKDFRSLEPLTCTTTDVALTHSDAHTFFQRAQTLTRAQVEDNYPTAPCFVEGTLRMNGGICDWRITAAATGFIRCEGPPQREWHFACDDCGDLLVK